MLNSRFSQFRSMRSSQNSLRKFFLRELNKVMFRVFSARTRRKFRVIRSSTRLTSKSSSLSISQFNFIDLIYMFNISNIAQNTVIYFLLNLNNSQSIFTFSKSSKVQIININVILSQNISSLSQNPRLILIILQKQIPFQR